MPELWRRATWTALLVGKPFSRNRDGGGRMPEQFNRATRSMRLPTRSSAEPANRRSWSAFLPRTNEWPRGPEFVVLGGLVPELLCAASEFQHAGTTDVDVQVDRAMRRCAGGSASGSAVGNGRRGGRGGCGARRPSANCRSRAAGGYDRKRGESRLRRKGGRRAGGGVPVDASQGSRRPSWTRRNAGRFRLLSESWRLCASGNRCSKPCTGG